MRVLRPRRAVPLVLWCAALALAPTVGADTVDKTWSFATSEEGFAPTEGSPAFTTTGFDSGVGNPAGSLYAQTDGKNKNSANYWEWSGTFEAMGVPAGATVSAIQLIGGFTRCTTYNTGAESTAGPWQLRDSAGTTVLGTLYSGRTFTTTDAGWVSASGTSQALANLASSTTVRVRLNNTLNTGNNTNASVRLHDDQVAVRITYTPPNPPPTVTITAPANGAAIGGPSGYTVTGTASDQSPGSVTAVHVRIQRSDTSQYWNGTGWTATETWNPASGTTSWTYLWSWTLDMDAVGVTITARATDNQGATGTATRTATVDSKAPVNTVATHLTPDSTPLSGESLTLSSSWTENSPGTNVPQFQWTLNGSTTGWSNADTYSGGVATRTTGVTLNGDDAVTLTASRFTDTFGNGPTLSQDTTTIWVQPLTPQPPLAANNGTTGSLDVTVQPNPSESGTVWYAIRCYDAGGAPTGWVQSNPGGCGGSEVWQTAAAWGSPVVVTGLSAATTYRFAAAAGNPNDPTPTTGENSASAYSTQASATTSAATVFDVTVSPPTATVNACTQITVSVAFTGDDNGNSTTLFERSPNGVDSWSPVTSCGSGTGVVSGPSPRVCVDTTVAESSVNYYRVDFTDTDGVNGTDPSLAIGPYDTTPYCGVDGTTIGAVTAEASSCNQVTVIARFTGDDDGDGSIKVESSPAGQGTWSTACAATSGVSPRQCLVPGLDPSASYDLRVTFTDPDGVAPDANLTATSELVTPTPATVSTTSCGTDQAAPALLVLVPGRDAIVGGTDRAKVQVFDAGMDATPLVSVRWSVDSDNDLDLADASENTTYDCGADCAIYEFDLATTALAQGKHYLTIRAEDAAGNVARLAWGFRVNNSGSKAAGDGFLLRRSHGSQLCIDCHNLKTHSSQSTSSDHGNWAISCVTCHTPHLTRNIYLIRETITTPNSGQRSVRFETTAGAVADSSVAGTASYANEDNAARADGICQACHTRTSDSSGTLARWRNSDSGGNADSHYGSSATSKCTGCHTHDAGFSGAGGACNSCHFAPPTVGKHGAHDQVGALPTGYTNLTPTTTPTQYGYACAKCHSGSHFNDPSTPHTVQVVFDATVDPKNAGGSYAPDAGSQATDPGVNGDGWYWSDGTCSSLYCHSNAAPLGGTDDPKSPTWDQATPGTCASCHSTVARDDGGTATDLSDTHGKHIQSASDETGSYAFTCDECHAQTIKDGPANPWSLTGADFATAAGQGKVQHVDGQKDVFFSATATTGGIDQSGGSYGGSPSYACSNTYCHSPGTKTSGFDPPVGTALAWNGGTSTCRSCHAGDHTASPTMDSGKHENHVNNAAVIGTNYPCATCHAATVSAASNTAITTIASHVNGAKNVSGTLVDTTYSSPTCTSSYCHSSGQAPSPPSSTSFEYYPTPDWFTATANALDCKGCHGRHSENAFTSVAGEPNYTNDGAGAADANSHRRHVTAATDCANCHSTTTTTGTAILASAPHTDQTRNVVIAAGWDTNGGTGADNYTPATKTCAGVRCHASGTPQWGATLTCLACHSGAEGGALGDGTPNGVAGQWLTDGHGSAAGGSLSSALDGCDYCHQLDAAHTPTAATNPYRLRFAQTDNSLCLQCHGGGEDGTGDNGISQNSAGTGLTPVDSSLDVDTAHFGAKHEGTEGGKLCWDCHDPHGVPTNILMVKSLVSKNASAYGVPATTVTVNFTNNTTPGPAVGRFVETTNTPRTGICQACHDPAGQGASGPTDYWRSNGTIETHNSARLCSDCHFHNKDFKGAGDDCLGCHRDSSQTGTYTRRAVGTDFANATAGGQPRSHHVGNAGTFMGGTLTNFDCVTCHMEGYVDTIANPDEVKASDTYHGGSGGTRTIDLRDADTNAVWVYDKNSPVGILADPAIAGVADWNSGSQYWREWTSGVNETGGTDFSSAAHGTAGLDPFCLSCHDYNGAKHLADAPNDGGGTAMNPFADTKITNEYDQVTRIGNSGSPVTPNPNGRVVDIASRVASAWRIGPPSADPEQDGYTASDRDQIGESRYDESPAGLDGRADPPLGVYSRHAIRGQSVSTYGPPSGDNGIQAVYWDQTQYAWEDNSVMGCADCHTTDGSGGSQGNAHGADSEYMLKNINGVGIEGTINGTVPYDGGTQNLNTTGTYNCYLCHQRFIEPQRRVFRGTAPGSNHTGNDQDYQDYTNLTGSARVPASTTGGNIYGMACTTCHGGALGGTEASPSSPPEFGTIHGTRQTFGVGSGGTSSTRQAYRFMNGNSMRFYQPPDASGTAPWDWTGTSASCYTIGSGDTFGGCTKHSSSSGSLSKDPTRNRDLKY